EGSGRRHCSQLRVSGLIYVAHVPDARCLVIAYCTSLVPISPLKGSFNATRANWQEIKAFEHPRTTSQALRFAFVSSRSALDEKPSRPHDGSSTCIHVVKLPCVQDPAFLPAKSDFDPPFVFEGLSRLELP